MKIFCVLILAMIMGIIGCGTPEKPDMAILENEISDQWQEFETQWEAENANGCASIYTKNAVNIPQESEKKEGRAAISSFYQMLFDGNLSSDYNHETVALNVYGDHMIEEGQFTVDWIANDSTEWKYEARSLALWVKDKNGKWLIDKFIFNTPPDQ